MVKLNRCSELIKSEANDVKGSSIKRFSDRVMLLTNIQEVLKWSNATPIRCFGRNGYLCSYCNDCFTNPCDLKKHSLDAHPNKSTGRYMNTSDMSAYHVKVDITELHCKICPKKMETLDQLMKHLNADHDKKLFLEVKNYMVPFKFDSDTLRCTICLNKFNKFKGLSEHMNFHCRNFVCKVCDAGFITRKSLVNHERTHESGSYKCKSCEKVFNTLTKKRSHEKIVHSGALPNKCAQCDESFRDYRRKMAHLIKVHGVEPMALNCHACDRSFTTQKAYRDHTKRYHLMEKSYSCTECEMKFYSSSELKKHLIKHSGVRKFQCDVCLKTYARKNTLTEHMRIHADDRRFKCEQCGMAFVQKCSWRGHMKTKHGVIV